MKRYIESDTTITIKEKRYLYYGYAFQKKYKPYARSKYIANIKKILGKDKRNKTELNKLIKYTNAHLENNPFDIEILRVQVYAYKRLRIIKEAFKKIAKIKMVKEAIMSSGNGSTKRTAYHVINIKHEYELLKVLGYKQKGRRLALKKYEYLKLEPNADHIKGLYFNLSRGMESINN
ncbi:MAG: DUF4919 domain-containing protein [Flavobacteriaceae bacterium]|nr:DUF4919 domain-containing protein [Flavobacteriaceae bacterium]